MQNPLLLAIHLNLIHTITPVLPYMHYKIVMLKGFMQYLNDIELFLDFINFTNYTVNAMPETVPAISCSKKIHQNHL